MIDNIEKLEKQIEKVKKAQKKYAKFTQEKVDEIFTKVAITANQKRIELAIAAQTETKMGVVEDKVIKNHFASEYIYNKYRDEKTCGTIYKNEAKGIEKIAEPLGVLGCVIPTTNPTSTTIFKILLALKTRNAIIISPHPRAKNCTIQTAKILNEVAIDCGLPEDIISWIDIPSLELTKYLMQNCDTILATRGSAMVKSAYSSGTPALGVGSGNTPTIIESSCNIDMAVASIIHSKTFDNGLICASEQSVIVFDDIYDKVKKSFESSNCYFLSSSQLDIVRNTIIVGGGVNSQIVGQSAKKIADICDINVPKKTKILIGEVSDCTINEPFAHEKLSPVLAMYRAKNMTEAINIAKQLVEDGGMGHTSSIYIDEHSKSLEKFTKAMKTNRILVNTPASFGGIGDIYNFALTPSLTLGCGSWGKNSISENVGIKHLLNIKTVAKRRENMLWLRVPEKVYIKKGCLDTALDELKEMKKKKVLLVTDKFLFQSGMAKQITNKLTQMEIEYTVFANVRPDPTLENAMSGLNIAKDFEPDCIIAFGGGSAMDAAKIIWALYENPNLEFMDMAMRFMDIRKRIYKFPKMGDKAYFIAIPTTAGTGSEVSPFAVITDEKTNIKYPIADYELLPKMAIVDPNLMLTCPKNLTAASGIDALVHSLEAIVSTMATEYTTGIAHESIKNIFSYLPICYEMRQKDIEAREKMANAATMAGIAFANSYLGVCHSMAHKLGAIHNIPHGIANALLISYVIKYNSSEVPNKMGTFPQYEYPKAGKIYGEVSTMMGFSKQTDELNVKIDMLIDAIEKLKQKIDIKKTIKDYGVDEKFFLDTLDLMSQMAFDDQCTGTNPRYPLIEEIKQIYLMAYYGKKIDEVEKL